jgi:hypothetical protein
MRSWTQRNLLICLGTVCLLLVADSAAQQASPSADGQAPTSAMVAATVPRLIRFSGVAKNAQGQPRSGVVGITFALYKEQEGGAALWLETQNVAADAQGQYVVLLGSTATAGVPMEAFSANEARWLGVQPEGQAEQRVLLVSVPYALKAADAETLGGMPASSFVLAAPVVNSGSGSYGSQTAGSGANSASASSTVAGAIPQAACATPPCNVVTSGGTANFLSLFTDPTTVQNSVLSQNPCPFDATQTCVGIANPHPQEFVTDTTAARVLDVNGEIRVGGGNIFMQRNLTDLSGRRNWAWGTETFNVGDVSLFVSASNITAPSQPVFTALSNGFMGIGVPTPHANLEIAGSAGGGLLVDSPGTITGSGAGLTSVPAAGLTGAVPSSALSGVNGSGLTNLNAANLTGTLPSAALPANVALVNAANVFSAPQTISTAGTALNLTSTGAGAIGLAASSSDLNGFGATITNSGGGYILNLTDGVNNVLKVDTHGLELSAPSVARLTNAATGTTLNTLVQLTSAGTVATASTTGNPLALGIVEFGAGTSGTAVVALDGVVNCRFDNATTYGDYVVISTTFVTTTPVAGDCHDAGAKDPAGGIQVVGIVLQGIASPGLAQIYLYGEQKRAIGSLGSLSFTGETAAIPATTLFTPLTSGLFRVNFYTTATSGTTCTLPCIVGNVNWQDENGAQTFALGNPGVNAVYANSVVIHTVGGQPIRFSMTYAAGTNLTYEAFVTLERLQ